MKRSFAVAFFLLVLMGLAIPAISAPLEVKGLLVYHDPSVPRFIEVIPYNQNVKKNLFSGELITIAGSRWPYKLNGVIEKIDYPAVSDPVTVDLANDRIKTLNALLTKYPKESEKFQHALAAWQRALETENNRLKDGSKTGEPKTTAPVASSANTEDIVTITGVKYANVTINRAEPDGLVIMTDAGIEKVPFAILPKELQTRYGYDPKKAAQYSAQAQAAAAQRQIEIDAARRAQAQEQELQEKKQATEQELKQRIAKTTRRIKAQIVQVTKAGLLVNAEAEIAQASSMASIGGGGGVYVPPDPNGRGRPEMTYGNFLVIGHPKQASKADKEIIDVDAYEDGVFTFTTVMGASRTVKKYKVIRALE